MGKTALLREFIRGKPAVYFLADRRPEREQLKEVAARLGVHLGDAFVEFLLKEELREPRNYMAILRAVAQGKRKFGEIVNETGLATNVLHKYLQVLEELQLTEREVPVTENAPSRSKRSLYGIQDPSITLWFQCGYPFVSDLELGEAGPALRRFRQVLPHSLGRAYERIARELLRRTTELSFPLQRLGRWWDAGDEIDLVGANDEANAILFGEVKWSPRPLGTDILRALREKAARVAWGRPGRRTAYALFGRSGFTPELMRLARREEILLFRQDARIA